MKSGVILRDVKESILVLVLLIDRAHKCGSRRKDLIDEDEDGLLRAQLNALADHVHELADGEVGWNEVLLLVDGRNVRLLDLLADNLPMLSVTLSHLEYVPNEYDSANATLPTVFVAWRRLTGMRSAYFWRMRSASALRFSNGCSSLNLERMMAVVVVGKSAGLVVGPSSSHSVGRCCCCRRLVGVEEQERGEC